MSATSKFIKAPARRGDVINIIEYLTTDGGHLTDDQQEKLDRLMFCDDQIRKGLPRAKVLSILQKRFNVSYATARNDFIDTKEVFGTVSKAAKDYDFQFLWDLHLEMMQEAREAGDYRAAAAMLKTMMAAHLKIREQEVDLPHLPIPTVMIITEDPRVLGREPLADEELKERLKKWTSKTGNDWDAIDTDYEELSDED